ncbi:MAG TPA: MerR family transcriptional regulator [Ktedonobacteraceae bacterium]|nr:MerR family transcriptional regulator [Ktedonobacteraceae bacterium]
MTVHEGPIEWPALEQFSDAPMFNTKAVVQQTGIVAPTLRAWERRYDLISPERAGNDYRLYSERDIVLIHWLKERVDSGMSISQAIALFHHLREQHEQMAKLVQSSPAAPIVSPPAYQLPELPMHQLEQEHYPGEEAQPSIHDWPQLVSSYQCSNYPATHDMNLVRDYLIESFRYLDEQTATMLMRSMLAVYPVEQVCSELISPTMWQIGQLWAEGEITISAEHFASNFFRALLANLFHVTPCSHDGPLTIICCAPGEAHELAALMLSLFMRRDGMRIAYLGQSIETSGLIDTIKRLSPALVCISLTMQTNLPALVDLGKQVQSIPAPRPILAFGGQAFLRHSHTIPQISGVYLKGDLNVVVAQLHRMVLEYTENKN